MSEKPKTSEDPMRAGAISMWMKQCRTHSALAVYLIWSTWLSLEYLALGPSSYVPVHDIGDSILPMRLALVQSLLKYGFGYWFPYAGTGVDRLSLLLNFFRFDTILFFVFPGWLAFGLVIWLQRFAGGYFAHRVCEEQLGLSRTASLIVGMAFAISFSSWSPWAPWHIRAPDGPELALGVMWFPFILWSLDRIRKINGWKQYLLSFLLGSFALFSMAIAGSLPFVLVMTLLWFVLVRRRFSVGFALIYSTFALVSIVGNIPTILALVVNGPFSERVNWPVFGTYGSFNGLLNEYMMEIREFLIASSVYLGCGLLGLILTKLRDRRLVTIVLLLTLCGVVSKAAMPLWAIMKPYIGFLSSFQIDGFAYMAPFFAVVAAGYGVHSVLRLTLGWRRLKLPTKLMRRVFPVLIILWLIAASLGIKVYHISGGVTYGDLYGSDVLQRLGAGSCGYPFRVATVAYQLDPAFANAYGLETVDGYLSLYPSTYQDFWGKVIEPLTSTDPAIYNYFHNWGGRIYLFPPSNRSFNSMNAIPVSEYYNLNLLSLANTEYIIATKPLVGDGLTPIATGQLYVYRNEKCFPRFFLAQQLAVFQNSTKLLEAMSQASWATLRNTAFIEQEYASIAREKLGFSVGNVTRDQYSTDKIVLTIDLDGPGILVVTNNYSQYWKCNVDGMQREIVPVYHTFSGIYLEAGHHVVTFQYDPPYWSFY